MDRIDYELIISRLEAGGRLNITRYSNEDRVLLIKSLSSLYDLSLIVIEEKGNTYLKVK